MPVAVVSVLLQDIAEKCCYNDAYWHFWCTAIFVTTVCNACYLIMISIFSLLNCYKRLPIMLSVINVGKLFCNSVYSADLVVC